MTIFALVKLGDEFRRLLWEPGRTGAIDLRNLYVSVHAWFAGTPGYGETLYPPASMVILWPFLGWLGLSAARWLWGATTVAALCWMTWLIVRKSGAQTRLERIGVALMLLSMNATGVAVGNGQLILHILPVLLTALLLLDRGQDEWGSDLLVAALFLLALVKPTVSAPFFWLVLFIPGRLRPALLVIAGYILLTSFAASFQPDVSASLASWPGRVSARASSGGASEGYANVHTLLSSLGLQAWTTPVSFLVLLALGIWTFLNRRADIWLLVGIAALAARFWTNHRMYDDVLILLSELALFRLLKQDSYTGGGAAAGGLLAATVLIMLIPARLVTAPPPYGSLVTGARGLIWFLVLCYLIIRVKWTTRAAPGVLAGAGHEELGVTGVEGPRHPVHPAHDERNSKPTPKLNPFPRDV